MAEALTFHFDHGDSLLIVFALNFFFFSPFSFFFFLLLKKGREGAGMAYPGPPAVTGPV